MEETINWLLEIERMAGQLYAGAANIFPHDRPLTVFLIHLADDEALHALAMGSALGRLHANTPLPDEAILLDESTRDTIENLFRLNLKRLQDGSLDRQGLLECIARTEFSEWNDIFLYVVNLLKEGSREFQYVAARVHGHQRMIEEFLDKEPALERELTRLKGRPPVWSEKILVVDDSEAIRELMEAVLEEVAMVEKAADAAEGLRKLQENYFDLIISDVNMPQVDGLEFYEQAVRLDPDLQERFLFYTGDPGDETRDYLRRHGLPSLRKPARIGTVKETVRAMLQKLNQNRYATKSR